MAGKELGQFFFTAMAKGMSEQMKRLKSKAQGENGGDGDVMEEDRRERRPTDDNQNQQNLRMFMDVVEDFKGLVAEETGIGKEAKYEGKDTSPEFRGGEDGGEHEYSPQQDVFEEENVSIGKPHPTKPQGEKEVTAFADLWRFMKRALPTGKLLGRGAFGEVEEMTVDRKIVAGKKFRLTIIDDVSVKKFTAEFQMLSLLHHPNIVAFEGLCHLPNEELPVLLMERLATSLHSYLRHPSHANLTTSKKVHILLDIANGLVYLHGLSPPLVHRDLTARNVLLTSEGVAKISDFGNARIMDIDPQSSKSMTSRPGTLEYMPPEAFGASAEYDTSLDVFSFGHLALFVAIQESPTSILPYADGRHLRQEVERRYKYLSKAEQLLGKGHLFLKIITQCLQNEPHSRPASSTILEEIHTFVGKNKPPDFSIPTSVQNDCSRLKSKLKPHAPADKRPTIAQLQLLHISGRRIEVIKSLAPRWHLFGDQLRFDSDSRTIDLIKKKHQDDFESGCKEMFQRWLRGSGVQPVNWRTLAQLLEDCEYKRLATDIRMYFNC